MPSLAALSRLGLSRAPFAAMALAARTPATAAPRETPPGFAAFQQDLMSVLKGSGTLDSLKAPRPTRSPPTHGTPARTV